VSHRELTIERKNIELFSGPLNELVKDHLRPNYKNVWLVGGSLLAKEFLRLKLVDEIRLSILPILLGEGTLFFDHIGLEQPLHLKEVTAYQSGMVELWYELRRL